MSNIIQMLHDNGYEPGSGNWQDYQKAKQLFPDGDYEEFIRVLTEYLEV